jgi:hypothetical protein
MKLSIGLCAFTALTLSPMLAHAQSDGGNFDRSRSVSVLQRPHPEYDALGVHLGGFMLYPRLETSLTYDDNIFSTDTNKLSDTYATVGGYAQLNSTWSRHALSAQAYVVTDQYFNRTTESHTDYGASTTGRLDIVRGADATATLGYDRLTLPRYSIEDVQFLRDPLRYDAGRAAFTAEKEFNRLRLSGSYNWNNYRYDNGVTPGGVIVSEKYQDRDEQSYSGRVDYAISPDTSIYAVATGNDVSYSQNSSSVTDRNSTGFHVDGGADFDLTDLMRGHLQIGYLDQSFSNNTLFPETKGVSASANIDYFLTPLTTINVHASRAFDSTGLANAAGYTATGAGGEVDYELRRNIIVTGKFDYEGDTFSGIDRRDTRYTTVLSGTYLLNRSVGVTGSFTHFVQNSNGALAGIDFAINRVDVKLTLRY